MTSGFSLDNVRIKPAGPRDLDSLLRFIKVYHCFDDLPDQVKDCPGGLLIVGTRGRVFEPPIALNDHPWFQVLFREFNRLASDSVMSVIPSPYKACTGW